MRIPVVRGVIDRRILVNYAVDPEVLARTLPAPFRPKLHRGLGLAGICLIRLRDVRRPGEEQRCLRLSWPPACEPPRPPGVQETVVPEETGVLEPPGDVDALAEAMREVAFERFVPQRAVANAARFSTVEFQRRLKDEVRRVAD